MKRLLARLLAATLIGAAFLPALPALAATAFVSLNGPGGSISRFDAGGAAALSTFATPPGATALLLSNDGTRLFVGTTSITRNPIRAGAPSLLAVLDAATGAVQRQFTLPGSVVQMVKNAAEDRLYATIVRNNDTQPFVMSLDLASGAIATAALPLSRTLPQSIAITPDGTRLFVPTDDTIEVLDTASLAVLGSVALPGNGIAAPPFVTPDGSTLLTVGNSIVYAIDTATLTLTKSLPIKTTSLWAYGAALSADGLSYYVSAGWLSKIDVPSLSVKVAVDLGQTDPFQLGLSADGSTLFATDLADASTQVVDSSTLAVKQKLHHVAPPWAVAVRGDGGLHVLNANGNLVARVDSSSRTLLGSFPVGNSPGAGVFASGRLFVPEVINLGVQEKPSAPTATQPIALSFTSVDSAAVAGSKVYANSGSTVNVINPKQEHVTRTLRVKVPQDGGVGAAVALAAAGDGRSLLASYDVISLKGQWLEGGLVKIDTRLNKQTTLTSKLFLPGPVASDRSGAFAYATGLGGYDQVGRWDLTQNRFDKLATLPGNPNYVALALSADGATLMLLDTIQGKIDFVDAATLQLQGSLAVGPKPSGIAVSADGSQAAVTDANSNIVLFIDLAARVVQGGVNVGSPSSGVVFQN